MPESWIEQSKSDTKSSRYLCSLDGTVVTVKNLFPFDFSLKRGGGRGRRGSSRRRRRGTTTTTTTTTTTKTNRRRRRRPTKTPRTNKQNSYLNKIHTTTQTGLQMCCSIVENPDHAVRSRGGKPSKLQNFINSLQQKMRPKCLVVLSQLRVFVDILPGYYIRLY